MRVRFLKDLKDGRSAASEGLTLSYVAGEVTHLETGMARTLIANGAIEEAPVEHPTVRVRMRRTVEEPHPHNPKERVTFPKGQLVHIPEAKALEFVNDGAAEEEPDPDYDPVAAELAVKKAQARASTPAATAAPASVSTSSPSEE